eukprot:Gregarina_sp_Pseudo_9__27@NODE_1019_length_1965_cov_300_875389_g956_i0_p1_GENE_NODE_1019_length_1965_cov_300_875389_g956_i0NODE_1019_length_1965_cov_300_875389_g956_i0_p1_ORF_typecomplete_len581_score107_37PGM_PMM_III/PF02880_16/2_8e27PGM_PMM_I/PF02878_16/3_8e26PGM_PMM_I/PF02878_16/6_4e03PGM_PMM_II/PF02879_16/3_6e19PGM_PMM_IV/PF00408_20/9_8e07_NODE_1019_length_1965_cov_300_875389_g956_i01251867
MTVTVSATKPYQDQKPGTSGLRKKVTVFQQENYLANFVQSIFDAVPKSEYEKGTLLCSGDGRYWNKEAIQIIAEIAAGNGVARMWVGRNGWMSTPAASCVIREREDGVAFGGILLTASHNPGGPQADFGIKYNCQNGGPAPESVTNLIFEKSKLISEIKRCSVPKLDLSKVGTVKVSDSFCVEVIDPVEDWLKLMCRIFDMNSLKSLVQNPSFSFVYDGLNGIAGPYARAVFVDTLGAPESVLTQCEPLEDFGGEHPDPNLTYAHKLVEIMKVSHPEKADGSTPMFGAAGDGDNDRNMILGRGWFVTPSDSVAIIAAYATKCIPYFQSGLKGVSRSMPTSKALAQVAEKLKINQYEVPTGWKFFGNLMDAGLLSICGEESFGTGSDHIREKDGLWAVLAWLSILAYRNKGMAENQEPPRMVSVQKINEEFWAEYGRNYYTRYDYEGVDTAAANQVMSYVLGLKVDAVASNEEFSQATRDYLKEQPLKEVTNFCYTDPVDRSVSANQGVIVLFQNGDRFVLRLSGTGSSGATIRLYIEKFEADHHKHSVPTVEAMKNLVAVALDMSKIEKYTGRKEPTVIT